LAVTKRELLDPLADLVHLHEGQRLLEVGRGGLVAFRVLLEHGVEASIAAL
jgi:hypothetical protein